MAVVAVAIMAVSTLPLKIRHLPENTNQEAPPRVYGSQKCPGRRVESDGKILA
jgi:hypothetical protein